MRTGDQIASHNPLRWDQPDSYLPAIIRAASGSFWNHWLGVWVRETDGVVFIVEMQKGGKKRARRITRFSIWQARKPDRIYEVLPSGKTVTRAQIDAFIGGYDLVTLFVRQPWYLLTGWWLGGINDRAYTCSELWARILGLPNAHRLSPKDMAFLFGASKK